MDNKPRFGKKWLLVLLGLAILGIGYHSYKVYNFKRMIKPFVMKDNILFEEILTVENSNPQITYGEFFDKAKKNIEIREDTIRGVKMLDPYIYEKELNEYAEFLVLENKSLYAFINLLKGKIESESKNEKNLHDSLNRLKNKAYFNAVSGRDAPSRQFTDQVIEEQTEALIEADKEFEGKFIEWKKTFSDLLSREESYQKNSPSFLFGRNLVPIIKNHIKTIQSNMVTKYRFLEGTNK